MTLCRRIGRLHIVYFRLWVGRRGTWVMQTAVGSIYVYILSPCMQACHVRTCRDRQVSSSSCEMLASRRDVETRNDDGNPNRSVGVLERRVVGFPEPQIYSWEMCKPRRMDGRRYYTVPFMLSFPDSYSRSEAEILHPESFRSHLLPHMVLSNLLKRCLQSSKDCANDSKSVVSIPRPTRICG